MANIYFDMDGVLVDYFGGLKDTAKKLGVAEDDNKAIWDEINKNPIEWWTNLNPIPDGMKLFNTVKSKEPSILSSAGSKQETKQGKLAWLKKNGLSPYLKEIVFVNNKSAKKMIKIKFHTKSLKTCLNSPKIPPKKTLKKSIYKYWALTRFILFNLLPF